MSQTAALRALDAEIVSAFADIGFADAASYLAPAAGPALPCTVLVDRAAQFFDEQRGVAGTRVLVTLLLAEVPAPERKGVVMLTDTGESFRLDQLESRDESQQRWVVVDG